MRLVFMGTPAFAVPCLKRMLDDGHEVALVVTQADKPKGRGHQMAPPPVKAFALEHDLPVYQPAMLKSEESCERLAAVQADVFVVVAYGRILSRRILDMPRFGCVNVHASLLPRYRGAAPIQWAVLNGDSESGVTTMQMAEGVDTGDMLLQKRCAVEETMTAGELHDVLSELGAQALSETLMRLEKGDLAPVAQDDSQSCYAPMLDKSLCPLDWSKPARALHNQIRGLNPWPSATCEADGKKLKIHAGKVGIGCNAPAGTVICQDPFTVACGEGTSLRLTQVQAEGGRRMTAEEYFRGHPLTAGRLK